jgi:hypothetical protein
MMGYEEFVGQPACGWPGATNKDGQEIKRGGTF